MAELFRTRVNGARSSLVIRGQVIERSDPLIIEHIESGARNVFTDYYVKIHEILRGQPKSDVISVRIEGGVVSGSTLVTTFNPNFVKGGEHLLFLTVPGEAHSIHLDIITILLQVQLEYIPETTEIPFKGLLKVTKPILAETEAR